MSDRKSRPGYDQHWPVPTSWATTAENASVGSYGVNPYKYPPERDYDDVRRLEGEIAKRRWLVKKWEDDLIEARRILIGEPAVTWR